MNINNCQRLIEEMYNICEIKKEEQIPDFLYLGKKCHDMIIKDPNNPEKNEFKRNMGNMTYCMNKFYNTKKKIF